MWISFVAILLLVLALPTQAATITADSCSAADVQTAMNAAGVGDTVSVPAGTCTWTSAVSWSPPDGASLIGAGDLDTLGGGAGATEIIDNYSGETFLSISTGATATTFRMAGFKFTSNGSTTTAYNGAIVISGNSNNVRLDHLALNMPAHATQMLIGGCVYGVMDNVISTLSVGGVFGQIRFAQSGCNSDGTSWGHGQWALPTDAGTANSFYIEDSEFNGGTSGSTTAPAVNDCISGGRWVVRYSEINGGFVQTHATGHGGTDRGCRAYEVYNNTIGSTSVTSTTYPVENFFYNTSGTGVIWNNNVTGYYKNFLTANVNRTNSDTYSQNATPTGWGYCSSTTIDGVAGPSNWDGNTGGENGWPCLDQIGRGQGQLLTGTLPQDGGGGVLNDVTGTIAWPNQAQEPVYTWGNTWSTPSGWSGSFWGNYGSNTQNNRDYYLEAGSFDGTAGVGVGTRSSRPATCTTGVAYWSTDQGGDWSSAGGANDGTLDLCSATDTWTNAHYTPYTYPHPLRTTTLFPALPSGETGIAVNYPNDVAINTDGAVLFADDFETYANAGELTSSGNWDDYYQAGNTSIDATYFRLGAKSLRQRMPSTGSSVYNGLDRAISPDLDEIYVRASIYFAAGYDGINSAHNGIQISANYTGPGTAPNGTDFMLVSVENSCFQSEAHPCYTHVYVYHPEQDFGYAEHWYPSGLTSNGSGPDPVGGEVFGLEFTPRTNVIPATGEWIDREVYVKLNTIGSRDGRIAVWDDGVLIADWQNVVFRTSGGSGVKIDSLEIANGGQSSTQINDRYTDSVVVANSYIGPVTAAASPSVGGRRIGFSRGRGLFR